MDKIPLQYILNLDNTYNLTVSKILDNINNFNNYLYNYVHKNYTIPSSNDPYNKSTTDEHNTNGDPAANKKKSLTLFNAAPYLFTNTPGKNTEHYLYDFTVSDDELDDVSDWINIENDVSGNNVSADDASGGINIDLDVSGNNVSADDASGGINIDLDVSGNNVSADDASGGINIDLDVSGNNVSADDASGGINIEKDNPGQDTANKPKTIIIRPYKLPLLIFPTHKKIIKKYYKKLIVKLHPDKIGSTSAVKFQKYYIECKNAKELNSLYKFWLLTKKIGIKIKKTEHIQTAFLKEINILKVYIENLEESIINKWINSQDSHEKNRLMLNYIRSCI